MNNLMKRILSLALALVLVLALVPATGVHVHATEVEETVATDPVEVPVEEPVEEPAEEPAEEPVEEELFVDEAQSSDIAVMAVNQVVALEGLTVNGLAASYKNTSESAGAPSWTIPEGNAISCEHDGVKMKTSKSALTLENKLGTEATLKFAYSLSSKDGKLTGAITGSGNATGNFEKVLADGESVTITLQTAKGEGNKTVFQISDITLISTTAMPAEITLKPAAGGSFTADGVAVEAATTATMDAGKVIALSATAAEGYQFFGWYNETAAKYVSYAPEYNYTVDVDAVLAPVFLDVSVAIFGVGNAKYDNLSDAAAAAAAGNNKTIILLNTATVTGEHTVPAGVTLLIPHNDANTVYGAPAPSDTALNTCVDTNSLIHQSWVEPTKYRELTMAEGAKINIEGYLEVSGQHTAAAGGDGMYGGSPTGPLGYIKMESGSQIVLKSGATLCSWGYIYGEGSVVAKSGAKVYENFQIMDFRGGSETLALGTAAEKLVFPLSQYYVQNIEVATTFEAGAEEHIATSLYISGMSMGAAVKFIGSGAMFQPAEGSYVVKKYDPANDELVLETYGDCALASMGLEVSGTKIDSADFILPLTNNIQIVIKRGTATLKQSLMMLPGSSLTVDQGAELNIAYTDAAHAVATEGGYMLQIFDSENWTTGLNEDVELVEGLKYCHLNKEFGPIAYSPSNHKTRTVADLTDVTLDINGTVTTNGFLYSTVMWTDAANEDFSVASGGGNIISSQKTGVVKMVNGAGLDMFGYLYDQDNKPGYYYIPLASAQLKNGDGTLLDTTGAEAGTVYNYCADHDMWYTGVCEPCENHEHNWTVSYAWASDLATCTATRTCDVAGCKIKTESATAAITSKVTTAPTCNDEGVETYTATFTVDWAATQTNTAPVAASGHSWGDATYTWSADGKTCTAKRVCKNDAKHVETAAATITSKETTAPTCKDKGTTTYTATFTVAWATTQTKAVQDIAATGDHNYVPGAYTWSADYKTCTVVGTCGCGTSKTATANATAAQTKAPTCTAKGETTYTATFAETWAKAQTKVVDNVPALNHAWGAASYTFAADGKSCSAKRVCGNDQTHVETANATITSAVKTPATCTTKGTTTYTATFSASWAAKQTKDVQDIAVIPHTYVAGTPAWGADNKSCSVTGTCSCGATAVANATVTSKVTKEATCYTAGETTYTAVFDKAWATTATKTVKNLPATGNHSFNAGEPVWGADYEFCKVTGKCTTTGCSATATATATSITVKQTKAPTCYAWGENTYTATFAEAWAATATKSANNIAPTGNHSFKAGEPVWGANYESCKVTGKCTTAGCSATATATATSITVKQTKAPTCADKGENTYTAIFAETWASSVTKTVANVPATGIHNYTEKGALKTPGTCIEEAVYAAKCKVCGTESATETIKGAKDPANHTFTNQKGTLKTAGTCMAEAVYAVKCDLCGADSADKTVKGIKDSANHASAEFAYVDNGNELNHTKKHACCAVVIDAEEAHAFDATTHACVCGAVDAFILTIEDIDFAGGNEDPSNTVLEIAVPYGAKLADYIPAESYTTGDKISVDGDYYNGVWTITGWYIWGENGYEDADIESMTMPAEGITITQQLSFTGWYYEYYDFTADQWVDECIGMSYMVEDVAVKGWQQIEGAWYYFAMDEAQNSYYAVAGLVRAPYPTEAINGVTYAPNADDLAYADFIDATESWFLFAEDGKFQNELTGMGTYNGAVRYVNKGQIAWNPGVVKIDNNYFYFMGDTAKGGNKLVKNDVYVYRNSTDRAFNIGGIYTFAADGKLCEYNGITTVNGKVRYYENAQLMAGNGLTKVGDHFIYVLSDGRLLMNSSCWIGANDLKVAEGIYKFDANGYLLNPVSTEKEGVIEEKGKLYYYENGRIAFNKGLLELADGSIIYVRSNGQVATGEYFITNVDNYTGTEFKSGDKLTFGADGKMVASKNGIIDGYYYENNNVAFNKGVIKLDGKYYYVRSNGQIVKGQNYWITNVGNSGVVAKQYTFAADGSFEPAFTNVNGIVDGYYYENGMIACGKGLVKLTDETGTYLIYVRSNGALATGVYWPTQKNGIDVVGSLDFGTDGKCYIG